MVTMNMAVTAMAVLVSCAAAVSITLQNEEVRPILKEIAFGLSISE